MVIACEEICGQNLNAADAVWVPNADQLHYPNISTCVSVTLVFANGLLGGHASQVTPNGVVQQPQNLQAVIGRMIALANNQQLGAFKRICYIGTVKSGNWNLAQATQQITNHFGQPTRADQYELEASQVDIVFVPSEEQFYFTGHTEVNQTAARSIELADEIGNTVEYLKANTV